LGIFDRAGSLKDRENTHSGSSPTDYEGGAPSTDSHRASPQRPAPDDPSAVPAPVGAEPSLSSTRNRPRACLEASHHTTVQGSRTILRHALGIRTIFETARTIQDPQHQQAKSRIANSSCGTNLIRSSRPSRYCASVGSISSGAARDAGLIGRPSSSRSLRDQLLAPIEI
jgi:hypothetical protein